MAIELNQINTQPAAASRPSSKKKAKKSIFQRDLKLPGSGFSDKKKEALFRELYTLTSAGMTLRESLAMLASEATKKDTAAILEQLQEEVVRGKSLSAAMEDHGDFSAYEFFSIRIGEESGRLTEVLHELGEFYGKKNQLKRQLISALTYPAFVLSVAFGVVYFMLSYIVPMFAGVFARFGGELPYLTKLIIRVSEGLATFSQPIFLSLAGIIVFLMMNRQKIWFKSATATIVLRFPFFGAMIRKIFLARFARSMHLLIASRTPLTEALKLVEKMIAFYPMEIAIGQIHTMILEGKPLHEAMAQFKLFDRRMVSLVKVGEEVNRLDDMFDQLASQMTEEVEHKTGMIGSVIEPAMIVFIAGFVGLILVAMYLPLFKLSTAMG